MREFDSASYARVLPLVPSHHQAGHMAFVHAVLNGQQRGTVYVDDARQPASALVFNHSGFAFALGKARPDLVGPLLPEIVAQPWATAEPTGLWATSPEWGPALAPFFTEQRSRDEFHFEPPSPLPEPVLPPGYAFCEMDAAVAGTLAPGLDPWVVRIWGGEAAYVRDAFGTGVTFGGKLVAMCTVCAIAGFPGAIEAEIEIGTDAEHRRKGLAKAAALRFFRQCQDRGLLPAWTCDSLNEPSQRTAAALGFREFRKVAGFPIEAGKLRPVQ